MPGFDECEIFHIFSCAPSDVWNLSRAMNYETLNAIAAHIETATGIKPTKHAVFSAAILAVQSAGLDLVAAFDFVLGAGAYNRTAGDLHAALNA